MMINLLNQINDLKNCLDQSVFFEKINIVFSDISKNKKLVEKIKKYNSTFNNELRNDIYNYDEIKKYKAYENEINLMIFEINNKLKKITINRSCGHESN